MYDRAKMHNAQFDVECLKSLFDIVSKNYESFYIQNKKVEFVESAKTKIVHRNDCRFVRSIREVNLVQVPMYKILVSKKQCKFCMSEHPQVALESVGDSEYEKITSVRKLKGKKVNYEQIDLLIEYFQLQCVYSHTYFLITTDYSMWRIYFDEGYVTKLEHENYKYKNDRRGYHNQHIRMRDMFSVMEYIVNHEKNPHKKKRIVELEKSMEREAKRKKMQKERRNYDDEWRDWKKIY